MPRVSGGSAGVRLPGIYADLRARERNVCGFPDPRVVWADPGDRTKGFYRRPRTLLEALEAGKPVVVSRAKAELAHNLAAEDWTFRFSWNRTVQSATVSPDDTVAPTELPHPRRGCAVDDAKRFA